MQLTVRGKQIDVGDALRTHVSDALTSTTAKYFNNAIEANVVFSRNAHLIRSDLSVHVGRNILLQSTAEAESPYHAFDAAADKLAKRLRRYKRRLRDHHNGDAQQPALPALMFRNQAHGRLNMVFRRPDGNIGWVDPKGTEDVAA